MVKGNKSVWISIVLVFIGLQAMGQHSSIDWNQVSEKAPWRARDSQGEVVYKNNLWIFGGWVSSRDPNLLDVWKSRNGKRWIRTVEEAPWVQSDLPASLVFKDKMWIMGGRKVPGSEVSNKVWSSEDGETWDLETSAAGWSPRLGAAYVVFKGKMWVMGGTTDFYENSPSTMMNDVWCSEDGKNWELVTANAGWSKRPYLQAVVYDDKIWVMGGGVRTPDEHANFKNDVWCSEDGIHWEEVVSHADWEPRIWFSSVVYRDRMWVLGGFGLKDNHYEDFKSYHNLNDVWYSDDGKSWTELKTRNIWTPRHEFSAYVFKDKIWIAGGAAEPNYALSSEVWNLRIPKNWFTNGDN